MTALDPCPAFGRHFWSELNADGERECAWCPARTREVRVRTRRLTVEEAAEWVIKRREQALRDLAGEAEEEAGNGSR